MFYKKSLLLKLFALLLLSTRILGQSTMDSAISLTAAIQRSEQSYHALKVRSYEAEAAAKNVDVAKRIRVPSIDASYQANFATANNLTGMFYPSAILPITGPPSAENNFSAVTGSAAGILLNWQAISFGQEDAQINTSIAEANSKKLGLTQEQFKDDINVISKYLDVALSYYRLQIQNENIKRVEVNLRQSKVLSVSGLRPGVDTAFFLSELSKARIEWLNTKKQLETDQWLLSQLMVSDFLPVPSDTSFINRIPAILITSDSSFATHPFIKYSQSQLDLSRSREQVFKKSFLPKLSVFGAAFGRGSGIQHDGSIKTYNGFELNRFNYGVGVLLTYQIMKYGEVKKQIQAQNFLSNAASENINQNNSELVTQQRIANTAFSNSVEVADETQKQLKSAQYAFSAMQSRYNTGLVNLSDIVQVQYNLLQAELAVKIAYWNAWKALLLQAYVKGDVNIFLKEFK